LSIISSILVAVLAAVSILVKQGDKLIGASKSKGPGLGVISELLKLAPGGESPNVLKILKGLLPNVQKLVK
jgi:hypothetical protein